MSAESCSVSSCTKPGTLLCAGCAAPKSRYCSKECQKRDWKAHKPNCAATQKSNCFLIRTSPSPSGTNAPTFADYIEPFKLQAYGDEKGERAELKNTLGWAEVEEAGKFYGHEGADTWYYYAYGPRSSEGTPSPKNEVASLCIGRPVLGDIAVVRSGPVDSTNYAESFSKAALVKTAEFYRTTGQSAVVFSQREMSRTMRRIGRTQGVP